MSVQRFCSTDIDDDGNDVPMALHSHGDYVRYSDYAALESRLPRWLTADEVPEFHEPQLWVSVIDDMRFCDVVSSRVRLLEQCNDPEWRFYILPERSGA